MRNLIAFAIVFGFLASPVFADAVFVRQTDTSFGISQNATTAVGVAPIDLMLITDYQTVSLMMEWDFDVLVAGGPDQPFETRVASSGYVRTDGDFSQFSFPDAQGRATSFSPPPLAYEVDFTVYERIVNSEQTTASDRKLGTGSVTIGTLTVLNYPDSISFAAGYSGSDLNSVRHSTTKPDGGTINFNIDTGFASSLTELLPGDFSGDAAVDGIDYSIWRQPPGFLAPLLTDFDVWKNNYGATLQGSEASAGVPEPAAVCLLALAGLSLLRRRRR